MENVVPDTVDPIPDAVALQAAMKSGANWFYWIGALSLINSLVIAFEGNLQFPVGLAITQLLAGLGMWLTTAGDSSAFLIVTLGISLFVSIIFAGLGYSRAKASRQHS